jgi:hypothetical protein
VVARQSAAAERARASRLDAARAVAEQRAVDAEAGRAEAERRARRADRAEAEAVGRAEEAATALAEAERRAAAAEAARDDADRRVAEADRARAEAERRATVAESARVQADERVAAAEQQLAARAPAAEPARDPEPAEASAPAPVDGAGLWALERRRAERTWRTSVAVRPDDPSPFADTDDDLAAAVRIDVAAVNEEVGARLELEWSLAPLSSQEDKVLVRRVVEELVAGAARGAEQGTIRVAADGADVVVAVDAVDATGAPEAPSLEPVGERVVAEAPGRVRLRGLVAAT